MLGTNETAQDTEAGRRVEKCIEAMSTSARHKGLARELLKLLGQKDSQAKAGEDPSKTIDV